LKSTGDAAYLSQITASIFPGTEESETQTYNKPETSNATSNETENEQ